jgi:antitoxin component of MazEF toxin-antitoxin module
MKFHSTVELGGKTATGIQVPHDVVEALGAGKRPAVTVSVGSHTYRTTVAPMAGKYYLPLSRENREAAGVEAEDEVEVEIDLDTEPRVMEPPDDLAQALSLDDPAREFFDTLSYSHRRAYVDWITSAKKPETRERRIGQAVEMLGEGKKR